MVAHSQIVIGTEASALGTTEAARSVPMLRVFGDPDDHLRLTALLATHLRSCSERLIPAQVTDLRDAADACLRPSTPWPERQRLVEELLRLARRSGRRHLIGLVDLDGLNPGRLDAESRWNDQDFRRQRRDFMALVLRAIDEGGWLVLRPNPSRWISQRLALTSAQTLGSAGVPSGVERTLRTIGPEQRPILAWLLRRGALEQDDIDELLELGGPRELQAHIVALAYDVLSPQARRAGELLSALRPPQGVNGVIGPFRIEHTPGLMPTVGSIGGEGKVPATAIRSLEECGFLQPERGPTGDRRALRMPRFVRAYLQRHVRGRSPEDLTFEHAWLGGRPFEDQPIADQLEIHFHAVHGGQIDRAIETARYYGSDLREFAFQRSLLASQERNEQERRRLYLDAARIYALIVDQYDASDAYAWEYRGYNLARAYPEREPLPDAVHEEILCAYQNAVERDPNNPLYHGRLLGFRVRLGEDVVFAFSERMSTYLEQFEGKPEAVSYFAEPVLGALDRLGDDAQRIRIEQDWGSVLAHLRRKRSLLDG